MPEDNIEYQELLPADETLKKFYERTLIKILSQESFSYGTDFQQDTESEVRGKIVRDELRSELSRAGYNIFQNIETDTENRFSSEKAWLEHGWENSRVWETEEGEYLLAVDFSLKSIFSPGNLAKGRLFPNRNGEEILNYEKVSELILDIYEAKTGTRDMPATAIMRISADSDHPFIQSQIQNLRSKGKIGRFGEHHEKLNITPEDNPANSLSPQEHPEAGAILSHCFEKFKNAKKAAKFFHGWTGNRWVMSKGEGTAQILETLGDNGVGLFYSGMGSENTVGWKINEKGKLTPLDYARQIATHNELTENFFDDEFYFMHSMGGHAGFYLRHIYDNMVSDIKERPVRQPKFAYFLENPALFEANIFLKGGVGILIAASYAREGYQGHLLDKPTIQYLTLRGPLFLTTLPVVNKIGDSVESNAVKILIAKHLIKDAQELQAEHAVSFASQKQAAAAQSAGLVDKSTRKAFDKMLSDIYAGSPFRIIISTNDNLVDQAALQQILEYSGEALENNIIKFETDHYPRMQEGYGDAAKEFINECLCNWQE